MSTTTRTRPKKLPAASLVLDYNIYPRHHIDSANVSRLRQAIEAGEQLPPVIADRESLRVIDGFNRITAWLRIDEAATIEVELRDYADDAAMFLDAVALNARHGLALSTYDKSRCMMLAEQLTIDPEAIAGAMSITVDTAAKLRAVKTAYDDKGSPLPIKRPLRHLAGSKLTKKQEHANQRSSGWSVRFHAEQIVQAIDGDIVDWSDAAAVEALRLMVEKVMSALPVAA